MGWELSLLLYIQYHLTSPLGDQIMIFLTDLGTAGRVWIALGIILLSRPKWRHAGVTLLLSLLLAHLLGNILLKPLVARPRPFVIYPQIVLKIPKLMEYSFPSGHSITGFAAAFGIPKKFPVLKKCAVILACAIAFSRLYLFMHFPTDVLAGAILGILIGQTVTHMPWKTWGWNVDK